MVFDGKPPESLFLRNDMMESVFTELKRAHSIDLRRVGWRQRAAKGWAGRRPRQRANNDVYLRS